MAIAVQQLAHRYGDIEALRGISVQAAAGRVTAILGPNAAGKSTLLRCIIGTIRPAAGAAIVDGKAAHALSAYHLAQKIAYVPQRSSVAAAFTVREVVELGRYALPPAPGRIHAALSRMELCELAERPYAALSVGQQQRVTLARALAQLGPGGHLVLDEPISGMDLRHAHDVMQLLRDLAAGGATVLIAMHDLTLAAASADDAWLLERGRLVAAGAVGDVLQVDRLREVYGVHFEWVATADGARVLTARPPAETAGASAA
jgi:iron complex transport system ATP-binding protein